MTPGEDTRSVRPRHDDPVIPEGISARDLHPSARNELKTLSAENAEWVALHLAAAASLIDADPALAHQHALSASRRAGRIAIVRETLAITAYANEDFALALRELRTYRRISGSDDQIALIRDLGPEAPHHFLPPSPRLSPSEAIAAFAARERRFGKTSAQVKQGAASC